MDLAEEAAPQTFRAEISRIATQNIDRRIRRPETLPGDRFLRINTFAVREVGGVLL